MNNFENPKNIYNSENLENIDQIAPEEEAITFSEKREILRNTIKDLENQYSTTLGELNNLINDLDEKSFNSTYHEELLKDTNESLKQIDKYVEDQKNNLKELEKYQKNLKEKLSSSKN